MNIPRRYAPDSPSSFCHFQYSVTFDALDSGRTYVRNYYTVDAIARISPIYRQH